MEKSYVILGLILLPTMFIFSTAQKIVIFIAIYCCSPGMPRNTQVDVADWSKIT